MKIAIASGKGGTGKTTVAVNLALALAKDLTVTLIDCDVEEPNCNLFLNFSSENSKRSKIPTYIFDSDKCTACGKCAKVCRFNAIAALKTKPMFFQEMCHGCGGCVIACPEGAIIETERENGTVFFIEKDNLKFVEGRLDIGEAMASPLIKKMKKDMPDSEIVLIDSPPGTACSMFAAVTGTDFALLVTEPTPFGLNDFKLAVAAVREMKVSFAAVINRDNNQDNIVTAYCNEEGIDILARIPDDRKIAECYSTGGIVYNRLPEYKELFEKLGNIVTGMVQK